MMMWSLHLDPHQSKLLTCHHDSDASSPLGTHELSAPLVTLLHVITLCTSLMYGLCSVNIAISTSWKNQMNNKGYKSRSKSEIMQKLSLSFDDSTFQMLAHKMISLEDRVH